jgi:hypothetical protein
MPNIIGYEAQWTEEVEETDLEPEPTDEEGDE